MVCKSCNNKTKLVTDCPPVETCDPCNGKALMCECVKYNGDKLPQTDILAGDNLCEALTKVDTKILELVQRIITTLTPEFPAPGECPEIPDTTEGDLIVWSMDCETGTMGWRIITGVNYTDITHE